MDSKYDANENGVSVHERVNNVKLVKAKPCIEQLQLLYFISVEYFKIIIHKDI